MLLLSPLERGRKLILACLAYQKGILPAIDEIVIRCLLQCDISKDVCAK